MLTPEWQVENVNNGELYLAHPSGARARMSTESSMATEILIEIPGAPEERAHALAAHFAMSMWSHAADARDGKCEPFRIDSVEAMRVARGAGVRVRGRHAFIGALVYFGPAVAGLYAA
jgi:hypothetical protein